MSLDRKLREGLDRLAGEIEPDVEGRLEAALEHRHRHPLVSIGLPAFASAAAILIVVVAAPAILALLGLEPPGIGTSPTPSPPPPSLVGSYTATVPAGDAAIDDSNLAGAWTIGFDDDGALRVVAPTGFAGTRTGYSYETDEGALVTDLFGSDVCSTLLPGTYRWQRVGDAITFTSVDDTCAGRAALLEGRRWEPSQ